MKKSNYACLCDVKLLQRGYNELDRRKDYELCRGRSWKEIMNDEHKIHNRKLYQKDKTKTKHKKE